MNSRWLRCFALAAVACLCAGQPTSEDGASEKLWQVMDQSKEQVGELWTVLNASEFIFTETFNTLAEGNYTIFAPLNSSILEYAKLMELTSLEALSADATKAVLYPVIGYHVVQGLVNVAQLPLNTPTFFNTVSTGTSPAICSSPVPGINITRISSTAAIISAGSNTAMINLTPDGPLASNSDFNVYAIDNVLYPCCLNLDPSSLNLQGLANATELAGYLVSAGPYFNQISGFLMEALKFLQTNAAMLSTTPITVLLPNPAAIAAAVQTLPVKNTTAYQALFMNHIIPGAITREAVQASSGTLDVTSVLTMRHGPLSCGATIPVTLAAAAPTNFSTALPLFGGIASDASYKLCTGGLIYLVKDVVVPCSVQEAVSKVANNVTTSTGVTPPGTPAPSGGGAQTAQPGQPAPAPAPGPAVTAASAAAPVASPVRRVVEVLMASALLLAAL